MDGSEQREGRKLRIAMLGSRGIPHTYSGYEIFPCWNLRAARSVASGRGDRKYGRNASCRECEKEPLRAYEVNALGSRNLAIVARELDAKLVRVSTDCVFDGAKHQPYVEEHRAAQLNVYGNTKFAGEEAFLQVLVEKYFIVRTSALYGKSPCRAKGGRNLVGLMFKLAAERDEIRVVDDELVSPTSTAELAKQIVILAERITMVCTMLQRKEVAVGTNLRGKYLS